MGFFTDVVAPAIGATYAPTDDFWYQKDPRWSSTQSGAYVSPEAAMKLGAVYDCVGLIADMIGSLPLITYRRRDDDGKDRATTHPAYNLLRHKPNQRQTAKEWRTMGTTHLLLRGNFYNEIKFDGRGAVASLQPLDPDRMKVTLLDSGRRGYTYRMPSSQPRTFTQDEIFHVMGLSLDSVSGCSVIEYARESVGTAQMQEGFAGRFWSQGAELGGVLSVPGTVNDLTEKAMQASWQEAHSGLRGAHKIALLQGGTTFTPITVKGRDAQYIESRNFSVQDVARFFRMNPFWLGVEGQWATGTGIEQLMIQLVTVTLLPWFVSWEQALFRDVLDDPNYFVEFLLDALLRGDTATRFQAYAVAIMNGIMSENEVRIRENLNPWPGLDAPRRSVNQDRGGNPNQQRPSSARPAPPPPNPDDEPAPDDTGAHATRIVHESAARLVRKEVAAVRKWAPRFAADPAGWRKWTVEFYERYARDLETTLAMSPRAAREYCDGHSGFLLRLGVKVAEEWERGEQAKWLAEIALSEREDTHG